MSWSSACLQTDRIAKATTTVKVRVLSRAGRCPAAADRPLRRRREDPRAPSVVRVDGRPAARVTTTAGTTPPGADRTGCPAPDRGHLPRLPSTPPGPPRGSCCGGSQEATNAQGATRAAWPPVAPAENGSSTPHGSSVTCATYSVRCAPARTPLRSRPGRSPRPGGTQCASAFHVSHDPARPLSRPRPRRRRSSPRWVTRSWSSRARVRRRTSRTRPTPMPASRSAAPEDVWSSDVVVKVNAPTDDEIARLQRGDGHRPDGAGAEPAPATTTGGTSAASATPAASSRRPPTAPRRRCSAAGPA